MNKYKSINFSKRLNDSLSIKNKYPNMLPIILINNNNNLKLLVSKTIMYNELVFILKKNIKIDEHIELLINNKPIVFENTIDNIYEKYKHNDGMLYISYRKILIKNKYLNFFKNLIKYYIF